MTAQPLPMAQANPLDQPLSDLVKTWWPVVVAIGGGLLAWLKRARKVWRQEREEQRLQGKAIREMLDRDRQVMMRMVMMSPLDEELVRHKALVDVMRDEFWVHDGHPSARMRDQAEDDRIRALSRTLRIKALTERIRPALTSEQLREQDMFREDDLEGGQGG